MKMSRKGLLISLILLALHPFSAFCSSTLDGITREDGQERMYLFFNFSSQPQYSISKSSRRIDLTFSDTEATENLILPSMDDRLIKMLKKQKKQHTVISLFFRYPPQDVSIRRMDDGTTLMAEVLLGNPFSLQYPDIARQLHGVALIPQDQDYTNPLRLSLYAANWSTFFNRYETEVTISAKPLLTLPPFPLAGYLTPATPPESWLSQNTLQSAQQGKWDIVQGQIRQSLNNENNPERRDQLMLSYGEAQIRGGAYAEPYKLLQQLRQKAPDSDLGRIASLLIIYLQAKFENPALAFLDLDKYQRNTVNSFNITSYLNILLAETAIMSGQYNKAGEILKRDNVAYSGDLQLLRLQRQADLKYLENKKISAFVSYLQLVEHSTLLYNDPLSLSFYSDTLYSYKHYQEAKKSYEILAESLTGKENQDLALFRLAMTRLKLEDPDKVIPAFSQIKDSFPDTEGASRASLKLTDLFFTGKMITSDQAAEEYGQITEKKGKREITEEAAFKQALVYALKNDNRQCVELLLQLLRNFQIGKLKLEARALLIEQAPLALHNLISQKRYLDALVLAKKNRLLFVRGWLDSSLLYDIADAYSKIGAFDESSRVYQYIVNISGEEQQEKTFLPLLETQLETGDYEKIETYANRYMMSYPTGRDIDRIFEIRLQALLKSGKADQAATLLDGKDRPESDAIDLVAASIYFALHRYDDVIHLLARHPLPEEDSDQSYLFKLAESFFQTARYDKAKPLFAKLKKDKLFHDQALFREGQILLRENLREEALNRFQQLADKKDDSLWSKLAREQIQITRMLQIN